MPVAIPTVAIMVGLLLHEPPITGLVSVVVAPIQIGVVPPPIAPGAGFTVKTAVDKPSEPFQLMMQVPAATPVVRPVYEPIVATATLLLLHVPVEAESGKRVDVPPTQTLSEPHIAA